MFCDADDDKEFILGRHMSMLCTGEDGDVAQFGDWTKRNLRLYAIRNGQFERSKALDNQIRAFSVWIQK